MIRHAPRERSGITLTEILISILIMGVGMISLATLFPLGLLRLRDAQRNSRSGYLVESAYADLQARNLLNKSAFLNIYFSPWNNAIGFTPAPYDPFVQDTPSLGASAFGTPSGVSRAVGAGLPIAYDPLWRFMTGSYPVTGQAEGRFGSGIGFIRNDPNPGSSSTSPSAWGLQRLTNFNPALIYPNGSVFSSTSIYEIFVSPEDIITQSDAGGQNATGLSTIVPTMNTSASGQLSYDNEFRFSWMFTGQQTDATNGSVFDGDIVIFDNRPFGVDQIKAPDGTQQWVAAGETTVEAIFGYSKSIVKTIPAATAPALPATVGYGAAANRTVLLRWPIGMPDPEVKVGNWFADVTYERNATEQTSRWVHPDFPMQRCYWYQVAKRTDPGPDPISPAAYRAMTVWTTSPLRAQTLMNSTTGDAFHVNAALLCPYVVYVFPRTIYSR